MNGELPRRQGDYDLGVLFVHGIGQQRAGRTVVSFGTALYQWLLRWNCDKESSLAQAPELSDAILCSANCPSDVDEPAQARLTARLRPANADVDKDGVRARWLLAESWWAEAFAPPRFLDLSRWLAKVATCMLVAQFAFPMHRHLQAAFPKDSNGQRVSGPPMSQRLSHLRQVAWYGLLMFVAASLSIILAVLLLALAVAAILPIPRIERAVQWVVVKLSSFLGDSYVLVRCPVEYASMRTRVARDLAWLQEQCERVVVVAHSQGAAIAHEVLKAGKYRKDRLRAFITIGQGITKLHVLQHLELDPAARKKALWSRVLVIVGLALAGLPAFAWLLGRWVEWLESLTAVAGWLTLSCLVVGFFLVTSGVVVAVRAVGAKAQADLLLPGAEEDFRWVDYFASADPVSNGPLGSESRQGPSLCNEILNRASVLTDHNGYLRNQDEFMSKMINDLVAVTYSEDANNPASRLVPHQLLEAVEQRRRRLIKGLIAGRWATLVVGILVWLQNYREILGFRLDRYLPSAILDANMGDPVVRLAPAAFVMFAFYLGVVSLWRFWELRLAERFFDREQADQESGSGGPEPQEPRHLASQTS